MDDQSSTDSNISLDSLENNFTQKTNIKQKASDKRVDTILVPFYENDVLMQVPKGQKRSTNNAGKSNKYSEKNKKETNQCYLVNKDNSKTKQSSYLEKFRKQFIPNYTQKKSDVNEIRSLSPEFGDTERESFEDDGNNDITEFYNTESYNEVYYEKLLNKDIESYMNNSLEDNLQCTEALNLESSANIGDQSADNLRSVSEVSHQRRPARRATIDPVVHGLKLGGLGPDVEKIKPRLERARSLQRYSEKVRMENRLRIYKKTLQAENDKKTERDLSARRRNSSRDSKDGQEYGNTSYLVNKSVKEKNAEVKTIYSKSKSADAKKTKARNTEKELVQQKQKSVPKRNEQKNTESKQKMQIKTEGDERISARATARVKSGSKNKCINTETTGVTPVHISFLVNVGGNRPSSALKTLEEKHKMYQEQVKAFMNE